MPKLSPKQIIPLFAIVIILTVFSGCGKEAVEDGQGKEENGTATSTVDEVTEPERTDCADELDTACWKTYRNNEYGFEVKYPARYENNKNYHIWDIGPAGVLFGGKSWGINKNQETLITIEAYSKRKKEKIFKEFKYQLLGQGPLILNNIKTEEIEYFGELLFVERDKLIYFIQTSYSPKMKEVEGGLEYNEYQLILKTIKID